MGADGPQAPEYQYKENVPGGSGALVFQNRAQIYYGGIHDATAWYGGNTWMGPLAEAGTADLLGLLKEGVVA